MDHGERVESTRADVSPTNRLGGTRSSEPGERPLALESETRPSTADSSTGREPRDPLVSAPPDGLVHLAGSTPQGGGHRLWSVPFAASLLLLGLGAFLCLVRPLLAFLALSLSAGFFCLGALELWERRRVMIFRPSMLRAVLLTALGLVVVALATLIRGCLP